MQFINSYTQAKLIAIYFHWYYANILFFFDTYQI